MKKRVYISILFVVFSVLYANLRTGMYFAYYVFDKEGFVEAFCQNQGSPEMHCNGKCKLADVASENERNPDLNFEKLTLDFNWIIHEASSHFVLVKQQKVQHRFHYENPSWKKIHFAIFHPPIFV